MGKNDDGSRRKRNAYEDIIRDEYKRLRRQKFLRASGQNSIKSRKLSSGKQGEVDVSNNDSIVIVSDSGSEDSDVCIINDSLNHANVANTILREIYSRSSDIKMTSDSKEASVKCTIPASQLGSTELKNDSSSSSLQKEKNDCSDMVATEQSSANNSEHPTDFVSESPSNSKKMTVNESLLSSKSVTEKNLINPESGHSLQSASNEIHNATASVPNLVASLSSEKCSNDRTENEINGNSVNFSLNEKILALNSLRKRAHVSFELNKKINKAEAILKEIGEGDVLHEKQLELDELCDDMFETFELLKELAEHDKPGSFSCSLFHKDDEHLPLNLQKNQETHIANSTDSKKNEITKLETLLKDNETDKTLNQFPLQERAKRVHERKRTKKNVEDQSKPLDGRIHKVKEINLETSSIKFSDVGGLDKTLKDITLSLLHMKQPELYKKIGIKNPPRGLLLHGPSGCGKTLVAHAVAGELQLPFIKVAATELVTGISGDSEKNIRNLFERATLSAPCILFIDEIDSIASKRDWAQRDMEKRMVTQILTCMDNLNSLDMSAQVLVIGATNKPDTLDPSLRRAGRFDREISIGIPDESSRFEILKLACKNLSLEKNFDLHRLARITPGYVGADLIAVVREAAIMTINRIFESLLGRMNTSESSTSMQEIGPNKSLAYILSWLKDKLPLGDEDWEKVFITVQDFEVAIQDYVPSAKREGFATVPNVTWEDVGALKSVKETLQKAILWPLKYKKEFDEFNLSVPTGILLCGPKGCGKTLLAKAVANECCINFLSVKGPELLNMYVGESERAVRECFQRAKNSAPCVIFFDEIDALCPQRSSGKDTRVSDRVVNQLLTEIDGIEGRKQVFVMGATNRPDNIDSAMLRPGRLEQKVFVGVPNENDRLEILQTITKNGTKPKLGDVNLNELAYDSRCDGFSGADLCSLVREASFKALEDYILKQETKEPNKFEVCQSHFNYAFCHVKPSVSKTDQQFFKSIRINAT